MREQTPSGWKRIEADTFDDGRADESEAGRAEYYRLCEEARRALTRSPFDDCDELETYEI